MMRKLFATLTSEDFRQWLRAQKKRLRRLVPGKQYEPRVVRRAEGGYEFDVYLGDPIAEHWYSHAPPEAKCPLSPEVAFLQRHALTEGASVFNLGAHHGVIALLLTAMVGPTGRVVAVEATPQSAAFAQKSRAINGFDNLHVVNAAISDRDGEIKFAAGNLGKVSRDGGGPFSTTVPARTVDSLAAEYGTPDVLFIDVEGYELHALRGASETLEKRPDCFVEVHVGCGLESYGGSAEALTACFTDLGYDLFHAIEEEKNGYAFEPLYRSEPDEWLAKLPDTRFYLIATTGTPPAA